MGGLGAPRWRRPPPPQQCTGTVIWASCGGQGLSNCASMSQHLFESHLVHKKGIHMHFRAILH